MVGFIDDHRETFGVEPICAVLPIAPLLYYALKARERDPQRRSAPARAMSASASTSSACGGRTARSTASAKAGSRARKQNATTRHP
jgi:hypothetical protein